jgi:transcriptional regulator with XRE-family HTH domain
MLPVYRALHALSVRELAKQIGVSAATVSRIEHGKMCDVPTFLKLLRWLMYQPLRVSL